MMLRSWLQVSRVALLAASVSFVGAVVPTVAVAQAPAAVAPSVRGLPDFTDLVDLVGPSVVNIRTLERARAETGSGPDEQMLEFFRRFGIPIPPGAVPRWCASRMPSCARSIRAAPGARPRLD